MFTSFTDKKEPVLIYVKSRNKDNTTLGFVKGFNADGTIIPDVNTIVIPSAHDNFIKFRYVNVIISLIRNDNGEVLYSYKAPISISEDRINVNELSAAVMNFLANVQDHVTRHMFILFGQRFSLMNQDIVSVRIDCPVDISAITLRITDRFKNA